MNKRYGTIFILGGYISGILLLGLQTWLTFKAFFSDSKSITIYVDRYGEMYGDIATFIFFWIVCLIGFIFLYHHVKKQDLV